MVNALKFYGSVLVITLLVAVPFWYSAYQYSRSHTAACERQHQSGDSK